MTRRAGHGCTGSLCGIISARGKKWGVLMSYLESTEKLNKNKIHPLF